MIRKCLVITSLGCLLFISGFTQSSSWKFRSTEYLGGLHGQDGNYGLLQSINGLYKNSWFLGIGAGLDYYRFRSVPLFLSVTKELMPKKNGLFLNLDGGVNFRSYRRPKDWYYNGSDSSKFHKGGYWSAGLGYKIKFSARRDRGLSLLVNYTFKQLEEDLSPYPVDTHYIYQLRELSLKIGVTL